MELIRETLVNFMWVVLGILVVHGTRALVPVIQVALERIVAKVEMWADTQIKKQVVDASVKMVEQLSKAIKATSEEKFNHAVANADRLLKEKGLSYSDDELKTLIESAVQEFTNK